MTGDKGLEAGCVCPLVSLALGWWRVITPFYKLAKELLSSWREGKLLAQVLGLLPFAHGPKLGFQEGHSAL